MFAVSGGGKGARGKGLEKRCAVARKSRLPIKKRHLRHDKSTHAPCKKVAAAAAKCHHSTHPNHDSVNASGRQPRTVSPAKTPSKKQNKMRNPYLKKTGGKDGGSKIGNQTVDNTMTPSQVLMALGRGCAIAGCQVKNCYGKLCLEGTGMCPVCGEKGKCPAVRTGKYNQCGNIAKFGHRMNDAVKSYGYCTRCLAPWRFGTHHTQGKDDDCVIHSRLQRIVLEKKPPRQSLEGFVTSIVSSPGSYNEFLCTVVAPMIKEKTL
ncbi:hypothetical protein THAOC_15709 [Thalassiosira oceanica]|uniref:Uncharacterized protein n=1 Tax=Thalassiosira oceanica TaxID=159749 RepID=K0SRI2_THAOC|nr:hypothetical protein THAOC_15709 [Thalassiosira oceanica]|eukprot:EJK63621.1 hypothetical protein THAOC_15709 [Thalassiosira oceanica]